MQAKKFSKVVLNFWDLYIFGSKTSFYEMLTVRPVLDQMSVTLSFKNVISSFVKDFLNFYFESEQFKIQKDKKVLPNWRTVVSAIFHRDPFEKL